MAGPIYTPKHARPRSGKSILPSHSPTLSNLLDFFAWPVIVSGPLGGGQPQTGFADVQRSPAGAPRRLFVRKGGGQGRLIFFVALSRPMFSGWVRTAEAGLAAAMVVFWWGYVGGLLRVDCRSALGMFTNGRAEKSLTPLPLIVSEKRPG